MEIKVNVPKGFAVFHKWVDGDLVITIEPVRAVRVLGGGSVRRHGHHAPYQRVTASKGKPALGATRTLVVTVDTDKRPTLSGSGTGSTGPREADNGEA